MKKIFVCSQYKGDVERNVTVARECCRFVISIGSAPFAPHLLYPQFLNDLVAEARVLGLEAGETFLAVCDEVYVFTDEAATISSGMHREIEQAKSLKKLIRTFTYRDTGNGFVFLDRGQMV